MYKLTRFFYHKICGQPICYNIIEQEFDSLIKLRNFVYTTYRYNYNSEEVGMDILFSNEMADIHCIVEMR